MTIDIYVKALHIKAFASNVLLCSFFSFLFQTSVEYLTFAAVSKLIAAGATYPYQVVRARLQDQHRTYDGAWHCIQETWRYERIRGFYKGLTPYLLHVTPNICLVMLIWEKFTNNDWSNAYLMGIRTHYLLNCILLFLFVFISTVTRRVFMVFCRMDCFKVS